MNAQQNAYTQMFAAVKATCDAHTTAWNSFVPFADGFIAFSGLLPEIETALARQGTTSEGATAGNKTRRTGLAASARILSAALVLHGKLTANHNMAADAKTTEAMHTKAGQKTYAGHVRKMLDMAKALPADTLEPYGASDAFLTNFETLLTAFSNGIGTPRHLIAEAARGTAQLDEVIEDLLEVLEERMDPAADVLAATQPDFYAEYTTSREIVDPGYLTRDLTVTVSDAGTGLPLAGVQATVTPGGIQKVTAGAGGFYIQDLDEGMYVLALSRPGYTAKSVPFAVVDGQGTDVITTMQPTSTSTPPPTSTM